MSWTIDLIKMGTFKLDGGAMFGIIPKPLWQRQITPDENNGIPLATNCMLLQNESHKVIIETGNGWNFSDKEKAIYGFSSMPSWQKALKPFQITCDDITAVIVSHLHFDHAGGLTEIDENGNKKLAFKNATHFVQDRQLQWAKEPSDKDRGSYRVEGLWPFTEGSANTKIVDGDVELLPGIKAKCVHGHTPYQQMLFVEDKKGTTVFVGDLLPTSCHLHIPYNMAYDIEPLKTVEEKKMFLKSAAEHNWTLWFYHDAFQHTGHVKFDGKRYVLA